MRSTGPVLIGLLALAGVAGAAWFARPAPSEAPVAQTPNPGATEAAPQAAAGAKTATADYASTANALHGDAPLAPGPSLPDFFYPGFDARRDSLPPARQGGRLIVHLESFPPSLNNLLDNSAVTRRMLDELHEPLIRRDWETWEYRGVLAQRWDVEDALVLKGGRGDGDANVLYGKVEDLGRSYRITPVAQKGRRLETAREVAKSDVESVALGTVYTFELRPGVRWHDGHAFDADDVLFTWSCTRNPDVRCGEKRWQYDKILRADKIDPLAVRFVFAKPYFLALAVFDGLTVLPAHLYDLSSADNPARNPSASAAEQARFVNENLHNREWVGLGPYRFVEWSEQYIEAQRWDGYFDPEHGGHVDAIRWRLVTGDEAAMQAVLEGELDFFARMLSDYYFGEMTEKEAFTREHYKGYYYTPNTSYVVWNTARAKFSDPRVRRALAMCFDWDGFVRTFYKGLGTRVTSEEPFPNANYDHALEPLRVDLDGARKLFAEAGWYDRDGDGLIDKDGAPFEIEIVMQAGAKASEVSSQLYQESLAKVGIRMTLAARDWATLNGKYLGPREFDAASLAWVMPFDRDPEQLWHSSQVGPNTANHASFADPEVDRLIESIQVEMDPAKRVADFRRLHGRLYDLQPYMWGVMVPRKFAASKRVRNLQLFAIDPGYSLRRWYIVEP